MHVSLTPIATHLSTYESTHRQKARRTLGTVPCTRKCMLQNQLSLEVSQWKQLEEATAAKVSVEVLAKHVSKN